MTMYVRSALVLSMMALSCVSCGGKSGADIEQQLSLPAVNAVIVDRVIEGDVLGRPLLGPTGLAVDQRGAVYMTDAGNHRLIRFNDDLTPEKDVGGFGSAPGLLSRPGFVSVDNGLSIVVADAGNNRLSRFDARLNFVDDIALVDYENPNKFGEPSGVALTDYGELWITDIEKDRIAVFDNTSRFDRFIAEFGYAGGQVNDPHKILWLDSGQFLVCDAGNGRLCLFDQFGNFQRDVGRDRLSYPIAAAVDSLARIWVVDLEPASIVCLSRSGSELYRAETSVLGLSPALSDPSDIEVLPDQRLLLTDSGNHRLAVCRVISADQ